MWRKILSLLNSKQTVVKQCRKKAIVKCDQGMFQSSICWNQWLVGHCMWVQLSETPNETDNRRVQVCNHCSPVDGVPYSIPWWCSVWCFLYTCFLLALYLISRHKKCNRRWWSHIVAQNCTNEQLRLINTACNSHSSVCSLDIYLVSSLAVPLHAASYMRGLLREQVHSNSRWSPLYCHGDQQIDYEQSIQHLI